jgi:hypothetical protein
LSATKVFDRVDKLENFTTPPTLVARVVGRIYGSPVLPLLPLFSFGVIPQFTQENHGESFSLSSAERPGEHVYIEYVYRGHTTLGWIALFEGILNPWMTLPQFDPKRSERFRQHLSLAIIDQSEKIHQLVHPAHN